MRCFIQQQNGNRACDVAPGFVVLVIVSFDMPQLFTTIRCLSETTLGTLLLTKPCRKYVHMTSKRKRSLHVDAQLLGGSQLQRLGDLFQKASPCWFVYMPSRHKVHHHCWGSGVQKPNPDKILCLPPAACCVRATHVTLSFCWLLIYDALLNPGVAW